MTYNVDLVLDVYIECSDAKVDDTDVAGDGRLSNLSMGLLFVVCRNMSRVFDPGG